MKDSDRSVRSVFVGNIPYDATEERLREIFNTVGPVLSFRIVFDRDTGKPKGYGFCEYKDKETATSAIRNLNGHDFEGRPLRVDSASNERSNDEPDTMATADHGINIRNQPAAPVEPLVDTHTLLNDVMMSLSPENLFDICKQMQTSLLVNPNETKQMLVRNPQLSYAILQCLVMIQAIDGQTAINMMHKQLMPPIVPMPAAIGPAMAAPMPMVMQPPSQPIVPGPMVMQQPIMNPNPFMATTSNQNSQPIPQITPVNIPAPMQPPPVVASADPRLARQQAQQQAQQPPQQQQQQQPGMSEQERQSFLMCVVNMTDQEISCLPPDQQEKIYLLRRQYGMQGAMAQ